MNRITPFLWFDGQLEQALELYTDIFPNARVLDRRPGPDGGLFTATFELDGQRFMGLNGGPMFQFTEAVSFFINCADQQEVDHYWDRLVEGGEPKQCGWLKDRFGLTWQVVPQDFMTWLDGDPDGAQRVMQAVMGMIKIDVAQLKAAYEGTA